MRLIAFLLAVALSASAYAEFPKIWQPPFSNAVAAQVGGSIITTDDLRRELAGLSNELKAKKATPEQYDQAMERASRDILAAMVEQRFFIEEFKVKVYKVFSFQFDNEY